MSEFPRITGILGTAALQVRSEMTICNHDDITFVLGIEHNVLKNTNVSAEGPPVEPPVTHVNLRNKRNFAPTLCCLVDIFSLFVTAVLSHMHAWVKSFVREEYVDVGKMKEV